MPEVFVLHSVLVFWGGEALVTELHRGSKDECEQLRRRMPAVCNSTGRQADAYMHVIPASDFDRMREEAIEE